MSPQQWDDARWEEVEPGVYRRRGGDGGGAATAEGEDAGEIEATDAAIRLAEENDIDLATLEGTGVDGRITIDDVRAAVEANAE